MIELILIKGKNIVKIWDNRNWEEKNSERVKCYIRLLSGISLYKMCFFNKKKKICILSKEYEVIQDYIMNTLKRGVTLYSAKGGYDKTEHTELVTIMATNEYKKLLYYLQESDIEAFVTVSTVNEVIGTWNTKKNHI